MTSHWKAVLGVLLIYLFGCFSGAVSTSIFARQRMLEFMKHPGVAASAALEKRLTGNLGLDADQKQKVDELFRENLNQRRELQKQIQPQVQKLNWQTFQQISTVLRPDQMETFRQNIEKFRKRLPTTAFSKDMDNLVPPASQQTPQPAAPATNSGIGSPPGE